MIPYFLYSNSYHFLTVLLMSFFFLILIDYYFYYSLTAHGNCVRVVLMTNRNILSPYKKLGTIIFNNLSLFIKFFFLISFSHKFETKAAPTFAYGSNIYSLT